MQKKRVNTPKKASAAKKKAPAAAKKAPAAKKKAAAAKKMPATAKKEPIDDAQIDEHAINLLPDQINEIRNMIREASDMFENFISDANVTLSQRRRKVGAGIRNYGFIDKASDLADSNPGLAKLFQRRDLKNAIRNIETCRDIVILLQTLTRMVSNTMLLYSDAAYTMALIFYNTARELARHGDANAIEVFRALQPFFRRPRHTTAEPTQKEIERDLHALIHGKKDGEIIVENESPKMTGGKKVLVDKTRKNKAAFKEMEEGEIVG